MNLKIIFNDKWFVLAIVSIVLMFIWFGIRPALIISTCQDKARQAGSEWWTYDFVQGLEPVRKSQLQAEHAEDYYIRCIHDRGLSE